MSSSISLSLRQIYTMACKTFEQLGTSTNTAEKVVSELLKNEINGYFSHGLLRIPEYIRLIKQGHIHPENCPVINELNEFVTKIDGQQSFGILNTNCVSDSLVNHLESKGFGFVTLKNSGHIGRLRTIGDSVGKKGGVVIGFSNLSGAGQNVMPYGGNTGRLCTNPMLFSIPSEPPIVIDMSTSTVSEGKLRNRWLRGEKVPEGWLFDKNWNNITDPNEFYNALRTALLGPLGGKDFGYKGFALGFITEIFAGILTKGGFSGLPSPYISNSGFFITFKPELFGLSILDFQQHVSILIEYLKSGSLDDNLRIPGMSIIRELSEVDMDMNLSIDYEIFKEVEEFSCI